jgi:Holliday junction resolvase RusA-like endonuclease
VIDLELKVGAEPASGFSIGGKPVVAETLISLLEQPALTFDIKPKPKARPRVTRRGITYMPQDYVQYCRRLSEMFIAAGGETLLGTDDQPLAMAMEFHMPMPKQKSVAWKKAHDGKPHALQRGDTDNLAGAVMDSLLPKELGGDHRVSHVFAWKVWARTAGVVIWLLPLAAAKEIS